MKDFDSIVDEAVVLCKGYDTVSPYLFQRMQAISLEMAKKVFYELESLGVITDVRKQEDDEMAVIANVDKENIRKLNNN